MKKITALLLLALLALGLFGCGESEQQDSAQHGRAIAEAANWAVEDIWNNGLCVLSYYKLSGAGPGGESVDAAAVSAALELAMGQKAQHAAAMAALPEQYAELQPLWAALVAELDAAYAIYSANKPIEPFDRSYELDTAALESALAAFAAAARAAVGQ